MNITASQLSGVTELKMISATSTYGIGFLTSIGKFFCDLLGIECEMYNNKVEMAKSAAAERLMDKALYNSADGIMNVNFQVTGLTVMVYGTAYKNS